MGRYALVGLTLSVRLPMTHTKESTAMHEAGHLLVVLATSLRERVREAKIHEVNGLWYGQVSLDPGGIDSSASGVILDYAKSFAGPIAQALFHPKTNPLEVENLIRDCNGSVLQAVQKILEENLKYSVGWAADVQAWRTTTAGQKGTLLDIERELQAVFRSEKGRAALRDLAERLIDKESLGRDELLHIPTEDYPAFLLPRSWFGHQKAPGSDGEG